MSQAFDSVAQGLREALAFSQGQKIAAQVHRPDDIDVAKLRGRLALPMCHTVKPTKPNAVDDDDINEGR